MTNNKNNLRRAIENLIHAHINQIREQRGLSYLQQNEELRQIARTHSEDMSARKFFAHETPDGKDPGNRYTNHGYNYTRYGENIACVPYKALLSEQGERVRYDTPPQLAEGIVDGWMNSEGHRENILSTKWNDEAIGINFKRQTGVIRVYATQNFS